MGTRPPELPDHYVSPNHMIKALRRTAGPVDRRRDDVPDELDVLTNQALSQLTESLVGQIATLGSALVAFSGGVDSSLVAAVAARVLGDRALAVTAVSPALASGELDGARGVAAAVGIRHMVITTNELSRPEYRRNDRFRCYHCKSELYDHLEQTAKAEGFAVVLSGAN